LVANHGCGVDVVCSKTCNVQCTWWQLSVDPMMVQVHIYNNNIIIIYYVLFILLYVFLKGTTPPNVVHQRSEIRGNRTPETRVSGRGCDVTGTIAHVSLTLTP
jgi:hypothetical protein